MLTLVPKAIPPSVGTPWLWALFGVFVLIVLGLDLGLFHRRVHEVRPREALLWALFCVGAALAFNVCVHAWLGREKALEFLTGYLVEEALSVDNLFVFLVIFSNFGVSKGHQHRVLFWGILGAILMRAAFILTGLVFLRMFHWAVFVLGGFLVFTGFKFLFQKEERVDPGRSRVLRLFRRFVPLTDGYEGARFSVRRGGKWLATPLLLVLAVVETTDLIFAVDSIPAVFAVTRDPFIVYTSNIFAVLGLRATYFLLANAIGRFEYLRFGLGAVLAFVGVKMLLSVRFEIPAGISLGIVGGLLLASIVASFVLKPGKKQS